jgi:hypothetical protein
MGILLVVLVVLMAAQLGALVWVAMQLHRAEANLERLRYKLEVLRNGQDE